MEDGNTVGFELKFWSDYINDICILHIFAWKCVKNDLSGLMCFFFFIMHNETALPSERPQEKLP